MGNVSLSEKLNIFVVGMLASILMYFVFQTLFASVIVDLFLGNFDDEFILLLIILGFELVALIVSVFVSVLVAEDIKRSSVIKAASFAYLFNLVFLITISYLFLFILYPEVFSEVSGLEIILIFPTVMMDFAIYVLGHPAYFFIFSIVSYYVFFIILIDRFYKYRSVYQKKKKIENNKKIKIGRPHV